MTRSRPSLRRVLVVAIGGVAVGAVLVTGLLTVGLLRLTAERTTLAQLRREAGALARTLNQRSARLRLRRVPAATLERLLAQAAGRVRCAPAGEEPPALAGRSEGRVDLEGTEVLFVSRPAVCPGGEAGTLYVLRPVSEVQRAVRDALSRVAAAGLAAVAVSVLTAVFVAGRISGPLRELAAAAGRLARGDWGAAGTPSPREPEEVAGLRDALREMSAALEAARQRERSFLLSVSHELRTPLTAIRGYGEALADGTARSARRAGEVVVREARRLERLVGDLLDLARLEAGEFSVRQDEADLGRVAREVADSLRPRAEEAGVRLEVEVDGAEVVQTDPDRLHQMVANLTENALRVTPSGGRVAIGVTGRTISVTDSGPGLEPEDLEHVFERFYLWRRYAGERPVGTGLGLAIVGELARLLGVEVGVSSAPGAGTRFTLTVP